MGFLKKIFRRKAKNESSSPAIKKDKKANTPRGGNSRFGKKKESSTPTRKSNKIKDDAQPLQDMNGNSQMERKPSFTGTNGSTRAPSSLSREPTHEPAVLSPRSDNNRSKSSGGRQRHAKSTPPATSTGRRREQSKTPTTPVDLDDEADFPDSDDENNPKVSTSANALTQKQLQQFNLRTTTQSSPNKNNLYNFNDHDDRPEDPPADSTPKSSKSNNSDDSSEFNLSTDAEDTEYNNMRRMTRPKSGPYAAPSALDVSHASTVSALAYDTSALDMTSPPSDEEEEDPTVFAALKGIPVGSPRSLMDSKHQPLQQENQLVLHSSANDDDMRAWVPQVTSPIANDGFMASPNKSKEPSRLAADPPATKGFEHFANFDDTFEEFGNNAFANTNSHKKRQQEIPVQQRQPKPKQQVVSVVPSQDTNANTKDTPLADLLAQAKEKRSSRSARHKASSSSINSAPAITPAYLRQQHLQRKQHNSEKDASSVTSVSDIIQNLELTNAARTRSSGARSSASAASASASSVRSAKERLKAKRRKERERQQQAQRSSSDDSDDDERFLNHAATAGKTSDQESLSGRSKNSTGQRSHKSHRSHRSSHRSRRHRSSHQHGHRSSSDSVGSKGSKRSNGSRYSHRSTRSYLSHMSEQSKSVANDLLRLEMQLAMVGSTENGRGMESGSMSGNSISGTSRNSRASRSSRTSHRTHRSTASGITHGGVSKRTKVNVFAPPGKLGIILANKADSKGTVVSGVRTSSVLVEKISPGDRIIAIDGEDVSRMTVSEITTIMARKGEFERILTVLTTVKPQTPSKAGSIEFENKFRA
mmetsp:Transcript_1034/g.1438  ORF Transcript_1034/g.1438 Transcript_1034/m.1438 type:complete len:817 (-) Transcript_1034:319-2769(-)